MSFMFETRFPQHLTEFAAKEAPLQTITSTAGTALRRNSTEPRTEPGTSDLARAALPVPDDVPDDA